MRFRFEGQENPLTYIGTFELRYEDQPIEVGVPEEDSPLCFRCEYFGLRKIKATYSVCGVSYCMACFNEFRSMLERMEKVE